MSIRAKTTLLRTTVGSLALTGGLFTALPFANAETGMESRIASIQAKYQPEFDALEAEGRQISENAPDPNKLEAATNIGVKFKWERTSIKFDVPEIKWKRREIKLHLPQTAMKTTSIKWDNPETFWAVTKIGEYPCFKGLKWYSCDITTKMPQVRMVRREAKFDVPQFTWDVTAIKLDIPEFYSKRVEIKLHLPQVQATDVKAEISKQQTAAEGLEQKAQKLAEAQKCEINGEVKAELTVKRTELEREFDQGIASLSDAIQKMKAAGVNPEAVQSDNGTQNLVVMLSEVQKKRAEALAELDAKIAETISAS